MIGHKLKREDCGGTWVFCGTTPQEVAVALKNELDSEDGLSVDERSTIILEPFEITQDEIENMPEFEGW